MSPLPLPLRGATGAGVVVVVVAVLVVAAGVAGVVDVAVAGRVGVGLLLAVPLVRNVWLFRRASAPDRVALVFGSALLAGLDAWMLTR